MEKLGQKIRKRREELGLKVYEFAKKVGVNPVYITQIEKHGKLPSLKVLKAIVDNLNTDKPSAYYRIYMGLKYPELPAILDAAVNSVKMKESREEKDIFNEANKWIYNYLFEQINKRPPNEKINIKDEKVKSCFRFSKKHFDLKFQHMNNLINLIAEKNPQKARLLQKRARKIKSTEMKRFRYYYKRFGLI